MTLRTYYQETGLSKATAIVISVTLIDETSQVILDHTIFHLQGGGQPSDQGSIAGIPVLKAMNNDLSEVVHLISTNEFDPSVIAPQRTVELLINESLRFKHAALHTAGHLIDHVVSNALSLKGKLANPSGNHFPEQAKITYDLIDATLPNLEQLKSGIEQQMDSHIANALPIQILSEPGERKRIVRIGDNEAVACGGTHVQNTRYIDHFVIRQIKTKKGKLVIAYDCSHSKNV